MMYMYMHVCVLSVAIWREAAKSELSISRWSWWKGTRWAWERRTSRKRCVSVIHFTLLDGYPSIIAGYWMRWCCIASFPVLPTPTFISQLRRKSEGEVPVPLITCRDVCTHRIDLHCTCPRIGTYVPTH